MSVRRGWFRAQPPFHRLALLACCTGACSGSDGAGLSLRSSPTALVDAGVRSPLHRSPPPDAAAAQQAPPPLAPTSEAPVADRGDDGKSAPTDAGTSEDATPEATLPDDAAVADATVETSPVEPGGSCIVTFEVDDAFIDGVFVQNVVIGGDILELGNWDPTLARNMAPSTVAGSWTLDVPMTDGQSTHFKFGTRGSGQLTWETLSPDSARDLTVSCPNGEGVSYVGQFGVSPDGD
jgi:hypothetical protein